MSSSYPPSASTTTSSRTSMTFACLFTKHKTQKRKIWQDGRGVLLQQQPQSLFQLYAAHPRPGSGDPLLDQCALSTVEANAAQRSGRQQPQQRTNDGDDVMMDTGSFLVMIEGPWTAEQQQCASVCENTTKATTTVSQGMRKLLQSKFRKPERRKDQLPLQQQYTHPTRATRKRPLQPGELYRTSNHHRQQELQQQHTTSGRLPVQGYGQQQQPRNPMPPPVQQPPPSHPQQHRVPVQQAPHSRSSPPVSLSPQQQQQPYPRNTCNTSYAQQQPPPVAPSTSRTTAKHQESTAPSSFVVPHPSFQASDFVEDDSDDEQGDDAAVASGPDAFTLDSVGAVVEPLTTAQQQQHQDHNNSKLTSSQLQHMFVLPEEDGSSSSSSSEDECM